MRSASAGRSFAQAGAGDYVRRPLSGGDLVHLFLERAADASPDHPFLIHEGVVSRYGEVEAGANRLGRLLSREGLARGDRVGLLAQNSRFYVEAYYAILKAGGIAVPLNGLTGEDALARLLQGCEARFLMAGRRMEKLAGKTIAAGAAVEGLLLEAGARTPEPGARAIGAEAAESESAEPQGLAQGAADVASIIYTSGSTGEPRGATLSHGNLVANTSSINAYLALTPADRVLAILPFYYVYGKSLLNTHAAAGGTVVIENRFLYPNVALDTLEQERCTGFSGVPSTFAILLNRSNLAERRLEDLRYVTQAGGGMSPALTRRLMEALPRQRIFIMYGATEASARLSYLDPDQLPRKLGSIGKAIPEVELRLLGPDGNEVAAGEVGEIVARGPNIMSGYWGDPEATAAVLDEDGYHTGDLARQDEEGFFFVVGRSQDIIKAGAHRISAREIEDAIAELAEVHESAVIGVPDEMLGEKVKAFVVLREGRSLEPRALEKALRGRLPAYKIPGEWVFLDALPKNESGKVMKQALRERPADEDGQPGEAG